MHPADSQLIVAIEKKKCYPTPYFKLANGLRSGVSDHPEFSCSASPGLMSRRLSRSAKHPAVVFAVFIRLRVNQNGLLSNEADTRRFFFFPSTTYTPRSQNSRIPARFRNVILDSARHGEILADMQR